jgi:type IV secretory pathway VirB4 component
MNTLITAGESAAMSMLNAAAALNKDNRPRKSFNFKTNAAKIGFQQTKKPEAKPSQDFNNRCILDRGESPIENRGK